ncbi:MAG TPA: carbon storage regulator CsrA [Holophagaceae bacterium]|nr:carbon storage regulator CsrA [Holophagaceae bacterium]
MLVITRRIDQSIMIGSDVEVVVLGITKEGVRLGIKAPKSVQVHRLEVFEAIAEENRAAVKAKAPVSDAAALLRKKLPQGEGSGGR